MEYEVTLTVVFIYELPGDNNDCLHIIMICEVTKILYSYLDCEVTVLIAIIYEW